MKILNTLIPSDVSQTLKSVVLRHFGFHLPSLPPSHATGQSTYLPPEALLTWR